MKYWDTFDERITDRSLMASSKVTGHVYFITLKENTLEERRRARRWCHNADRRNQEEQAQARLRKALED